MNFDFPSENRFSKAEHIYPLFGQKSLFCQKTTASFLFLFILMSALSRINLAQESVTPFVGGPRKNAVSNEDLSEIQELSKKFFEPYQPVLILVKMAEPLMEKGIKVEVYNLIGSERNGIKRLSRIDFFEKVPNQGLYNKPGDMLIGKHWMASKIEMGHRKEFQILQINNSKKESLKSGKVPNENALPFNIIGEIPDDQVISAFDFMQDLLKNKKLTQLDPDANSPEKPQIISLNRVREKCLKVVAKRKSESPNFLIIQIHMADDGKWIVDQITDGVV